MNYKDIEQWLESVGYELDISKPVKGVNDSIEASIRFTTKVLDATNLSWKTHWEDHEHNASVRTTRLSEAPVFTCIWSADVDATIEDFLKTTYRDNKFVVSSLWDPTYIRGEFIERYGNEEKLMEPGLGTAKIANATFKVNINGAALIITVISIGRRYCLV